MEKKLIDYEGFEAYAKGVREKYAEKKDIPTSLSNLQEDSTHRTVQDTEKTKWDKVTNKVDKVDGKQLSSNDYTNEDKKKVEAIPDNPKYTDTIPDLTLYAKKESMPTKISQLENDKTFKTESEIQSMIEKASSLKKEVVTSLPTTGKDDVIYLVKDSKGKDNNNYLEYLWLNGKYELIGSTQVDLSGYVPKPTFDDYAKEVVNHSNLIAEMQPKIQSALTEERISQNFPEKDPNKLATAGQLNGVYEGISGLQQHFSQVLNDTTTMLNEVLKRKVEQSDIQEFTQQELEEAFK